MNVVCLPATAPDDTRFGKPPTVIDNRPGISIRVLEYAELVWYNRDVRERAMAQIRALALSPVILVGFSKSGLGAWNIARAIPEHIAGTIIFDSPVALDTPMRGALPFYADNPSWHADLPIRTIETFRTSLSDNHRLVLISGPCFHDHMSKLSTSLSQIGHDHVFISRRHLKHHWNSGWIEDGLDTLGRKPAFDAAISIARYRKNSFD